MKVLKITASTSLDGVTPVTSAHHTGGSDGAATYELEDLGIIDLAQVLGDDYVPGGYRVDLIHVVQANAAGAGQGVFDIENTEGDVLLADVVDLEAGTNVALQSLNTVLFPGYRLLLSSNAVGPFTITLGIVALETPVDHTVT